MYSFAIILQEFHTRKGPFSNNRNLCAKGRQLTKHRNLWKSGILDPVYQALVKNVPVDRAWREQACMQDRRIRQEKFSYFGLRISVFFFNLQIFDSYMYDEDGKKPFVCLIKKL